MKPSTLPDAKNWNDYWSSEKTQRFTKISWSKRRIIRILQPYIIKGKRALDAGCGSGFFAQFFSEQDLETTALDYSPEALEITAQRTKRRISLVQMDLVKEIATQHINQRFDLIFTDGLLEHFERSDQDLILRNLVSLLDDQGVIFTFVPNRYSPWELIRPLYMPGIEEKPFVLKHLIALHQKNGLKVLNYGGINTLPCAFSPDSWIGSRFGMLLYTISVKRT